MVLKVVDIDPQGSIKTIQLLVCATTWMAYFSIV